jgi:hypothetical protein
MNLEVFTLPYSEISGVMPPTPHDYTFNAYEPPQFRTVLWRPGYSFGGSAAPYTLLDSTETERSNGG